MYGPNLLNLHFLNIRLISIVHLLTSLPRIQDIMFTITRQKERTCFSSSNVQKEH